MPKRSNDLDDLGNYFEDKPEYFEPGRPRTSERICVEDCLALSNTAMTRDGVFKKGPNNFWTSRWYDAAGRQTSALDFWVRLLPSNQLGLVLSYTVTDPNTGQKIPVEYVVEVTTPPCPFGGQRYWFQCSLLTHGAPCKRRVGRLYLPPGGLYFGCRICYNLTYRKQKQHDKRFDPIKPGSFHELMKTFTADLKTLHKLRKRIK